MTRRDFQTLAAIRLSEAQALLAAGHLEGAYYLAGYSIECALKACVAKRTQRYEFPDKARALASHSHKLAELVLVAGLHEDIAQQIRENRDFQANWNVVMEWTEVSRYNMNVGPQAAGLIRAISNPRYGVLRWIKQHW